MKKYFTANGEITEQQAREIEEKNKEFTKSIDLNDLLKIQIIIVIDE